MIRLTIDVFSGLPNPSFMLNGPEATEMMLELTNNRDAVTDLYSGFTGLGFRGLIVDQLSDDAWPGLPATFKIGGSPGHSKGLELTEKVIHLMEKRAPRSWLADYPGKFDEKGFIHYLLRLLKARSSGGTVTETDVPPTRPPEVGGDGNCQIERATFNPGYWNAPGVIGCNNCYNYASNRRTDNYAQPGYGVGKMATANTCDAMSQAAIADGCQPRYNCFPATEKPRWLMALVTGPWADYHWYRLHTQEENFWGHKLGINPACNLDNSNQIIRNPETCDRGDYCTFCGYFYSCLTQQNRIKGPGIH